ncbi:hypothetical protein DRE_02994 [Drechslerella stenobrocha 248]|uniref:TM7S3/TM198-like domain-containing protein n=1 Tax=Drechslerella stenobrocha 248 TaxID=1043628 RepID=W7HW86_9PEZI|nr:hypothetical protein DRE_02994 [Drechslerella stenobrocha 248]
MRSKSWLHVGLAVCTLVPTILGVAIRDSRAVIVERDIVVTYVSDHRVVPQRLRKRQEGNPTTSERTDESSRTSTQSRDTATSSAQSRSQTSSNESTREQSSTTEGPTSTSTEESPESSTTDNQTEETSAAANQGGLPYEPPLTPAFGFAGFLLLVAGVPYTLAGVRHKQIHIFMSTCLLASLGVTVLIIYVMNAPVSNSLQGGYVAAAAVTGSVLGGLAVIFPEVTEILACVLGGFCLAQWFLVLRPGGLVQGGYQKIIFILAFSIGLFCLALHHVTRPYGMIFSIAFSGATATVLGIDFFSKAGLKEFWLYIWGLNENIFPLGTNTFPLTRGIRVEIAAIVVVTGFGIISQMKLWQVIKQKRDHREEERRQMEADIEAMESENGRRIEESAQKERELWEKQYGDKSSTTLVADALDPNDPNKMGQGSAKDSTDEITGMEPAELDANQVPGHKEIEESSEPKLFSPAVVIREKGDVEETPAESSGALDPQTGIAAPTAVHTVIIDSSEKEDDDDASSLATFADSVAEDKRKSDSMSARSGDDGPQEIPHDDAASSVAGVLDDDDERSETELPLVGEDTGRRRSVMSIGRRHSWASGKRNSIISLGRRASLRSLKPTKQPSEPDSPQLPELQFSLADEKNAGSRSGAGVPGLLSPYGGDGNAGLVPSVAGDSVAVEPTEVDPTDKELDGKNPSRNVSLNSSGGEPGAVKSQKEQKSADGLPAPLRHGSLQHVRPPSRIVKTYRVSEWAKHLDPAEEPQYDDLEPLEIPESAAQEKPVPVHVMDLQEGISGAKAPPPIQGLEKSASEALNLFVQSNSGGISKHNSMSSIRHSQINLNLSTRQAPPMPIQIPTHMPTSPISPIAGSSSPQIPTVIVGSPHLSRRASQLPLTSPILSQPLVESPVEEAEAESPQTDGTPEPQIAVSLPPPPPGGTLLTKRESMLKATPNFGTVADNTTVYAHAMTQPQPFANAISPNVSSSSLHNNLAINNSLGLNMNMGMNMSLNNLSNNRRSTTPTSLVQQRSSSGTNYAGSVVSGITPSSRVPSMDGGPQLLPAMSFSPFMAQNGAGVPIPVPHGAVETAPMIPQPPAGAERRQTMLRAWRESLMQDQVISARTHNSIQDRRNLMIQEHVMMNAYGKQKEYEKGVWEGMVDERYKHQNMLQMHRDHMRKMQDKAKGI